MFSKNAAVVPFLKKYFPSLNSLDVGVGMFYTSYHLMALGTLAYEYASVLAFPRYRRQKEIDPEGETYGVGR